MRSHWQYDRNETICPLCKQEQKYPGTQFVYINNIEHKMCSACYSKLLGKANTIIKQKYEDLAYMQALQSLEKENN